MVIQESGEMYLESIEVLSMSGEEVHAIDVAEYLGYSKPSVSRGLGILRDNGLVEIAKNGALTLTAEGKKYAKKILDRHIALTEFFIKLGVPKKTAEEDACRIEHVVSDKTMNAIKKHMKTL